MTNKKISDFAAKVCLSHESLFNLPEAYYFLEVGQIITQVEWHNDIIGTTKC